MLRSLIEKGINPRIWGFHVCGFTQWRIENSIFDPHLGILESGGTIHIPTSLIESVQFAGFQCIYWVVQRSPLFQNISSSHKETPQPLMVTPLPASPWQPLVSLSLWIGLSWTFHTDRIRCFVLVCDWPVSLSLVFKVHTVAGATTLLFFMGK